MKRVPSGELHVAEDGLAYHGGDPEPFTGVAFELGPQGTLDSEVEYRDGLRSGLARGWHRNGQLAEEIHNLLGVVHGTWREWDKEGKLVLEQEAEYGILLWERRPGSDGAMVETYRLTEADPDFEALQQLRQLYGQPSDGAPA